VSQAVRQMIDEAYKEALRERRIRAARELARLAVEDVPDPATLSRRERRHSPSVLLNLLVELVHRRVDELGKLTAPST